MKEGEEASRAAVAVLLRVVVLLPRHETTLGHGAFTGEVWLRHSPPDPLPAPPRQGRSGAGPWSLLGVHAITAAGEVIGQGNAYQAIKGNPG